MLPTISPRCIPRCRPSSPLRPCSPSNQSHWPPPIMPRGITPRILHPHPRPDLPRRRRSLPSTSNTSNAKSSPIPRPHPEPGHLALIVHQFLQKPSLRLRESPHPLRTAFALRRRRRMLFVILHRSRRQLDSPRRNPSVLTTPCLLTNELTERSTPWNPASISKSSPTPIKPSPAWRNISRNPASEQPLLHLIKMRASPDQQLRLLHRHALQGPACHRRTRASPLRARRLARIALVHPLARTGRPRLDRSRHQHRRHPRQRCRYIKTPAPQFNEREFADLTFAIATINTWNRLAISFRVPPGHYKSSLKPITAAPRFAARRHARRLRMIS